MTGQRTAGQHLQRYHPARRRQEVLARHLDLLGLPHPQSTSVLMRRRNSILARRLMAPEALPQAHGVLRSLKFIQPCHLLDSADVVSPMRPPWPLKLTVRLLLQLLQSLLLLIVALLAFPPPLVLPPPRPLPQVLAASAAATKSTRTSIRITTTRHHNPSADVWIRLHPRRHPRHPPQTPPQPSSAPTSAASPPSMPRCRLPSTLPAPQQPPLPLPLPHSQPYKKSSSSSAALPTCAVRTPNC